MDPSEIATQIIEKEPDLDQIHNAIVRELMDTMEGSSGSTKKKKSKKEKSKVRRSNSKRYCSSGDESDDLFEELRENTRDPEALRQLKVLEQLQEELLDLQKTSDEEFDVDNPNGVDDDDAPGYQPPSNQQAVNFFQFSSAISHYAVT